MSQTAQPSKKSTRGTSGIDHDGDRRPESLEYIEWEVGTPLPELATKYWMMLKWWNLANKCCSRALITSLGFSRHSWTGVISVKFTYTTWNRADERWDLV